MQRIRFSLTVTLSVRWNVDRKMHLKKKQTSLSKRCGREFVLFHSAHSSERVKFRQTDTFRSSVVNVLACFHASQSEVWHFLRIRCKKDFSRLRMKAVKKSSVEVKNLQKIFLKERWLISWRPEVKPSSHAHARTSTFLRDWAEKLITFVVLGEIQQKQDITTVTGAVCLLLFHLMPHLYHS